jgi:hypothetical protein
MAHTVAGTNRLCCTVAAEQIAAFLRGEVPSTLGSPMTVVLRSL